MTSFTVEAVYERGTFKLDQPLPLGEHQRVQLVVYTGKTNSEQSAGLMGWKGPAEMAEYFAMSPELELDSIAECDVLSLRSESS